MHRAFVTAVDYFRPDVVFFLGPVCTIENFVCMSFNGLIFSIIVLFYPSFKSGDLFDEGQYVNQQYFDKYVTRFASLFPVPDETQVFVVPGNHDVGFHNE